ncbi:hypothetical protein LC76P1_00112 [Lysinibacillus phage LC76P1]|nr:hypothetical protein LC76P1_00112 [Lysinibacillus phage LC76P1]
MMSDCGRVKGLIFIGMTTGSNMNTRYRYNVSFLDGRTVALMSDMKLDIDTTVGKALFFKNGIVQALFGGID